MNYARRRNRLGRSIVIQLNEKELAGSQKLDVQYAERFWTAGQPAPLASFLGRDKLKLKGLHGTTQNYRDSPHHSRGVLATFGRQLLVLDFYP
jgi:hypothetical protein